MGNYQIQQKRSGCSEFLTNLFKFKSAEEALPAEHLKRPRKGESNHILYIPTGETLDKLENKSILTEVDKGQNGHGDFH